MAYSLEYDEELVIRYLLNVPLSREGRVKLFASINHNLRHHADSYRTIPEIRLAPGSEFFWYDFLFVDEDGDGMLHGFRFVVSDVAAAFGVLRVAYEDAERLPPPEWMS